MIIAATFNPALSTTDKFTVAHSSANGKMVVYNESNISLTFAFQNGYTAYVPAWMAVLFHGQFGNVNVTWTQQTILASGSPPLSQVVVEVYDCHEAIPGTFPTALVRQTNLGNTTPLSTSTSNVANDGNITGTSVIEATVSGDSGSAVSLTNDAVLSLGTVAHPGSVTLKGPLTSTSTLSVDSGNIVSDGLGNIVATSVQFNEHAAPRAKVSGDTGGNLNIDIPNGTRNTQFSAGAVTVTGSIAASSTITGAGLTSSNNITLNGGKINLIVGTLTRMTAISGTGNATVNTNCGTTPNTVAFDPCTLSGSSQTIGGTTAQSTVVTTGSGLAWAAMAYVQ